MSEPNALVVAYLKGEPLSEEDSKKRKATCAWFGSSLMRNSNQVIKELCAASDDGYKKTMWDQTRKLWGTTRLENVVSLVASGLWAPNGVPPSMKDSVALEAKKIVDAQKKRLRDAEDANEQAAKAARDRVAAEAIQKQAERLERERQGKALDEADVEYAWKHFGLEREILLASPTFAWLGPHTSDPIVRIKRWFGFTHNREAGPAAVIARDFKPAYDEFVRNREAKKAGPAASGATTAPKRTRVDSASNETMEDMRRRELERVERIKERNKMEENDEHAKALAYIIERGRSMPPWEPPYARECPTCGAKPLEQFMECSCRDDRCRDWELCRKCNSIWHPQKLACLCMAE